MSCRRILVDPDYPLDWHQVLDVEFHDEPEAFLLPDLLAMPISEARHRRWAFRCREIMKLPLTGAYRALIQELRSQLDIAQTMRERARVKTQPIRDEGTHEGELYISRLLADDGGGT